MLEIKDLHAYYGPIEALRGVDITVPDGKICCIIGTNGSGKTTLLKSISNVVKRNGTILFDGSNISNASAREVALKGIVHVPEGRRLFPGMTVYQNLEVGTIRWHGFWGNKKYDKDIEMVFDLFPRLAERRDQQAWSLSGGEQQMLAIGRGLMARPKILMLDEPSMGLAPLVIDELFKKIIEINKTGVSILLNEQNAKLALKISDYGYVLDQGQVAIEGECSALRNDARVTSAYFGNFAAVEEG